MENIKPDFLFQIVSIFVVVFPLLVGILSYQRGKNSQIREIHPQPFVVSEHQQSVSDTEFKAQINQIYSKIGGVERGSGLQIENLRKEIKADMEAANKNAEHRSEMIHQRINKMAEDLPMKIIEHLQHLGKLK